jgi:hypothetical protein
MVSVVLVSVVDDLVSLTSDLAAGADAAFLVSPDFLTSVIIIFFGSVFLTS